MISHPLMAYFAAGLTIWITWLLVVFLAEGRDRAMQFASGWELIVNATASGLLSGVLIFAAGYDLDLTKLF